MQTSAIAARARRSASSTPAAALLFGLSLIGYLVVRWLSHPTMIDLAVYRVEGLAIRDGLDLYGNLPTPKGLRATYPPFAGLLFVPISYLAWTATQVVISVLNVALLVLVCHQACRLADVGRANPLGAALVLAAIALWAEPVVTTFRYGQINLLLLALVQWDFLRPANARSRGVGIGLAAAIKITPAIFVVYLVLTRRFRMALTAVITAGAATGISALVAPSETWRFWTRLVWDSGRVGRPENAANQSLRGLFARAMHTRDAGAGWDVLALCALLAGLACAAFAYRRLGDSWGAPACAITGMLVAPIAWSHHWVWCIPIAVLVWAQQRRWLAAVAVFWTFAIWAVPHVPSVELHFAWWQIALSAWYVLAGLAFLALTLATARAADRTGRGTPQPVG